ncbi:MAG: hypothetical protein H7329_16365 [Opitutaceae bacterium]|nr:hypothetical protein [Cytophagales bacterium]
MKNEIRKQNEEQALRIFNICKQAQYSISNIENELIYGITPDPGVYQVIERYKREIDSLADKYLGHIEECSQDLILVDPEMINGLKNTVDLITNNLRNYFISVNKSIINKGSTKPTHLFFPDYL